MDFFEHRLKYEKRCKAKDFLEAVKKVEEFIKNSSTPTVDVGMKITVKQERELIVKQEIESEPFEVMEFARHSNNNSNNNLVAQIEKLEIDKAKIADELTSTKRENQKIYLGLQQKNREIEKIKLNHQNEIEQLQQKNEEATKEIKRLTHTCKVLTAQNNQLKLVENFVNSDNMYEVEKIMNHRIVNGEMSFLVRWKNYSPKHDSWVTQSDLNCEEILKAYLNLKRL